MIAKMEMLIAYVTSKNFMAFASDTRVILALAIVFIMAILFRWKWVLVFLLLGGGMMAIIRYTSFQPIDGSVDPTLLGFILSSILITVAIIYLVFIRSD